MMREHLMNRRSGFTIVELVVAVAILALLASIAVPNFLRARKRSQATRILDDLRHVDAAKDQYALEYHKAGSDTVSYADLVPYFKPSSQLYNANGKDVLGNTFVITTIDAVPKVNSNTLASMSDVIPASFWSPYN